MPDVSDYRRFGPLKPDRLAVGTRTAASGAISQLLRGSKTFDWPSIAAGAQTTTTVTVTGAVLGDMVLGVSMDVDTLGVRFSGQVTAANTVTVTAANGTGGALDIASGTLAVLVAKTDTTSV